MKKHCLVSLKIIYAKKEQVRKTISVRSDANAMRNFFNAPKKEWHATRKCLLASHEKKIYALAKKKV